MAKTVARPVAAMPGPATTAGISKIAPIATASTTDGSSGAPLSTDRPSALAAGLTYQTTVIADAFHSAGIPVAIKKGSGLLDDPAVARLIAELEPQVLAGGLAPGAAARRILAAFRGESASKG